MRGLPALCALLLAGAAAAAPPAGRTAAAPHAPTIRSEVPAAAAPVAVVFDDFAAAGDAKFARARAEDASRLLARAGLPTALFPQSALRAALAEPCRVAHLAHFSTLSADDRAALDAFLARGGRVVVHGSFCAALAAWFGAEKPTLAWRTPSDGGAWAGFRFAEPRPLNAPAFLANRAERVPRLGPGAPDVRVVGRWTDAAGTAGGPPALLRGPKGFWFVRTLYGDGSARDRARLLSALTCALAPPLWKTSSLALEADAWRAAGASDLAGAETALARRAGRGREELVHSIFHAVRKLDASKAAFYSRGLYGAAQSNLWAIAAEVRLARAAALPLAPVRAGRPLAVWLPGGRLPSSCPSWRAAAAMLASAGVTDLYLHAGSLAGAVGPLPGVPKTAAAARSGDPFPEAVAACRVFGIRVHAWLPALQFEGAPDARFAAFAKARRLLHEPGGKPLGWLDPAVKANVEDLARAAVALARIDGLAGVHLDFLRYPDAATREKRSAAAVTALLVRIRREVRAAAPASELSAAVYGSYPAARNNVGQAWQEWLAADLLDRAVPMNYVPTLADLRRLLDMQKTVRGRLVCGVGACARETALEPDALLEQLREAYAQGCAGAAIYAFDDRFVEELLPALRIAR